MQKELSKARLSKGEERMTDAANAASELEEKNKVIAHLTKTLASTRECLEIARAALERIANESRADNGHVDDREIASEALSRI
jgi:hypothetical protein